MVDNNHPPRGRHVHSGPIVAALALLGIVFVFFVFGSSTDQPWGGIAFLLGVPFGVGMLVGENVDRQRAMGCFVWPTIAICGLLFLAYLIFGEGVLCIAIVLPLWISAAIGGALTSLWVHGRDKPGEGEADDGESRLRMAAWTILPSFLIAIEIFAPPTWSEHEVVREVIVKATPAQVWPQLAQIRHVRPKEGRWTFTHDILGIPRPVDARLEHDKDGLVRKARWGEGIHFNERIVTQDTDRAMQWRFIFPDKSLQNHTDRHIAPDGETLHILSGGYRLDPLQDGRTRIRLSTRCHAHPASALHGMVGRSAAGRRADQCADDHRPAITQSANPAPRCPVTHGMKNATTRGNAWGSCPASRAARCHSGHDN